MSDYADAFRGNDLPTEVATDENEGLERFVIEGETAMKMRGSGFACHRGRFRLVVFRDLGLAVEGDTLLISLASGLLLPMGGPMEIVLAIQGLGIADYPAMLRPATGGTMFQGRLVGPTDTFDFLTRYGYVPQGIDLTRNYSKVFCRITPLLATPGASVINSKVLEIAMGYALPGLCGVDSMASLVLRCKIIGRDFLLQYVDKHAAAAEAGTLQRGPPL